VRQLLGAGDERLRRDLAASWGEIRSSGEEKNRLMARYRELLTLDRLRAADLSRGRALFRQVCASCHKLFGEGGAIGPDLTGSNRSELDYLLGNIVDPSTEVAQDYRLSIVGTHDGRVITGIVVERSPNRLVVQTATEKITLAKEDVEAVKDSPNSIMPEGQLDSLTREQVRDLIAYLAAKAQVPLPPDGKK